MKELSIEEKAKAYDEAKARMSRAWNENRCTIGFMNEIFPKLKESEDEKVRKELIKHLKDGVEGYMSDGGSEDYARWLAWLEKQCYTKKDVDDAYLKGICNTKHELEKQGDQKSVDKEYTFKSIPRLLDMIEPTDRAKSYCKKLIDSLQTEGYSVDAKIVGECLKQMNGEKVAMAVMDNEKQGEQKFEMKTAEESLGIDSGTWNKIVDECVYGEKPVDKVVPKFKVKYAGCEYNVLEVKDIVGVTYYGIEDEPNHIDYVKADNCKIISGYAIKEDGSSYPTKPVVFSEQKSQRMVSAEAKEALYDKPTDEEMKELLRTEYEKGRADTIAEMKSSWSEEDEHLSYWTIHNLTELKNRFGENYGDSGKCIDWIKQLKQRIGG